MTVYSNVGSGGAKCGGFAIVPDPLVVLVGVSKIDVTSFKLTFRSQRVPPVTFRVFNQGTLVQTIVSASGTGSCVITVGNGESPFVEILDDPSLIPHYAAPGRLTLNWRRMAGASNYNINEWIDSEWVTLQTQPEDIGNSLFLSPWLEDSTTYQWQVVPLDSAGNSGTPIEITTLIVRHPDAPNVAYTYNGATTKTVTLAQIVSA
jgi:hypothetical protein